MRILLTNWDLKTIGGSQLWTYTMYKALMMMGHDVSVYSPKRGEFSKMFHRVEQVIPTGIDLAIINQSIGIGSGAITISNRHSTFVPIEDFRDGSNAYVSVSEEIKNISNRESVIILNPIDNIVYFKKKSPKKDVKTVLYMNHDGGGASKVVKQACDELGAKMITLNGDNDISPLINKADFCIGIGRCLIEAMICGRPVISGDQRSWMSSFSGYGVITVENYADAQKDNYSGRVNPKQITKEYIVEAITKYKLDDAEIIRKKAIGDHNFIKVANDYLKLYETLLN